MATVYTYTVDTDGVSGDYSSLSLAITGIKSLWNSGDLVTSNVAIVIECASSTAAFDTTPVNVSGFITSVDCSITIKAKINPKGQWNDSRYTIDYGSSGSLLSSTLNYFYIIGIQLRINHTDGSGNIYGIRLEGNNSYSDGCLCNIVANTNPNYDRLYAFYCGKNGTLNNTGFRNCIAFGSSSNISNVIGFYLSTWDSCALYAYNCLSYNMDNGFGWSDYSGFKLTNCVALDNSWEDFPSFTNVQMLNCASSDTSATGTNCLTGLVATTEFLDVTTFKFSPASGSQLIGSGSDLSAVFADDIAQNTRTAPWDIGPFKYLVTTLVDIILNSIVPDSDCIVLDSDTGEALLGPILAPQSGVLSTTYAITSDINIIVRVRKSSPGDVPRYLPYTQTAKLTSASGFIGYINQVVDSMLKEAGL